MKTCDTCRFWEVSDSTHASYRAEEIVAPTDPDTFKPMRLPFEVRVCACPRLLFCERPVEENGACVVDGSTYYAGLFTGPKFGCTFHEEAK